MTTTAIDTRLDSLMNNVHTELEVMYPTYNRQNVPFNLAKLIFEASDVEDFCIPFDAAWQLAEYATKGSGKRVIKSKLRENIDYKITGFTEEVGFTNLLNQNSDGKRGGDRRTETIILTPRGFCSFALLANTPAGQMLRDFVFAIIRGVKLLRDAIARGEVILSAADQEDSKIDHRIKICETQKALMAEIKRLNMGGPGVYARVNGATNKHVTGRYKHETAKLLGLPANKVNARDYMTRQQLLIAEAIEEFSKDAITQSGGEGDAVEIHTQICKEMTQGIAHRIHGQIRKTQRTLQTARRELAELEATIENEMEDVPMATEAEEVVADEPKEEPKEEAEKPPSRSQINYYFPKTMTVNNF